MYDSVMDAKEDLDVSVDGSLADHVDEPAEAGPAEGDLLETTGRGVDAAEDSSADGSTMTVDDAVSSDDTEEEEQASALPDHRKRRIASIGAVLCVVAVVAGFDAWGGGPLFQAWDSDPRYAVSRIDTPDVLLAADGSTAPADVWRKNRHGAPYKRTIDVQLQFDAGCTPSAATAHASKTGSRWMDLDIEFKPAEGKTCDGKKTEWTWWRVSVDGVPDAGSRQIVYESVLPLDDATSVTASWDGWPGGKKGPLPQWKTQMDKLD